MYVYIRQLNCLYLFPLCRKSGGRTDTAPSRGKLPVVYEKAKRLRLSDISNDLASRFQGKYSRLKPF